MYITVLSTYNKRYFFPFCLDCKLGFYGFKPLCHKCPFPSYGIDCQSICDCDNKTCSHINCCFESIPYTCI